MTECDRGTSILPELFKAIEESRISVIFSQETMLFRLGAWMNLLRLLDTSDHQQMIFPIFYQVL